MVTNAAAIKHVVSVPVIASGRIEPESAEQHIREGNYDFLGMGRKILADPDLPNKITSGVPDQIRPCVYCYCCVSQIYVLKPVKCAVNPETAFENTSRELITTDRPRHIAVIGGGPGGMEAARRLSIRGFRVSLFESGKRLGGTLQFASIAYKPNERLMDWLRLQIKNSDVEVNLNTTATVETITRLNVEEVIVATGAARNMPTGILGSDRDFVLSGEEMRALVLAEQHPELKRKTSLFTRLMVLAGSLTGATGFPGLIRQATRAWLPLGQKITIIGNELVGLELAEFLAERGRKVTVIDNAGRAGKGLYLVRRLRMLEELDDLGVVVINKADEISINDQAVTYISKKGEHSSIDADHVIVAKGATGNTSLAEAFNDAGIKTHVIGDCDGVSYIEGAMEAAAELTATL
jgi:NADPH-dependent 2,4-dienoyl-CoA reductase/sulfur reductase-like enzyme